MNWRADAPATLAWIEALDGGDPAAKVAKRDAVKSLSAPFAGPPTVHAQLDWRGQGVVWARNDLALVTEGWRRTRTTRTWAINPSDPAQPRRARCSSARPRIATATPGRFEVAPNAYGRPVLLTTPTAVRLPRPAQGASAEGDRPFIDRFELATGKTSASSAREAPYYEDVIAVLDPDAGTVADAAREHDRGAQLLGRAS